jgi:hypothetical protein
MLAIAVGASAQTLTVVEPMSHAESPRLTDIRGGTAPVSGPTEIPHHLLPPKANYQNGGSSGETEPVIDSTVQTSFGPLVNTTAGASFDGMNVYEGGYIPSDNNIAVGPNHIVETVNAAYSVYDKNGNRILGPNGLRSLWTGLGGACAANNGGDPIVQYDKAADRWMITQLGSLKNPYSECIAISKTADPTGAYNLYAYSFGTNLNDYPKFGVWPTATNSAYLATYNLFANGSVFAGPEICAYDRAAMIAGSASPVALCYTGISGDSFLPADLDGTAPPLDGTPGYFVDLSTSSSLGVYKLSPNFAAQTATISPLSTIAVTSYTEAADAPQPGTSRLLDALSDRLMYRAAFRMFGDHESIVINHAIKTAINTVTVSGVRWYELQSPVSAGGSFSLYQQGTFAPDSSFRWMGSAAMDRAGNMAIGYSVSSSSLYPSVRYTGRGATDLLGTVQSEASMFEGSGSQTGYARWGDYSSMRIDPADDCTFWYVNEYLPVTSSAGWYTRIGSFKFSGCGQPTSPDFSVSASPSSLTITQGNAGVSNITVSSIAGFTGNVDLSVTGCPAVNTTCDVSPTPVDPSGSSASSTLTVTTTASTSPGAYNLVVSGTGISGTHTANVALTVNAPPAVFDISLSANTLTVAKGSKGSLTVNTTGSGSITLSVSGVHQKTNASFSVNPVAAGSSSVLTIAPNPAAKAETYTVTVTGTIGGVSHSKTFSLTIN